MEKPFTIKVQEAEQEMEKPFTIKVQEAEQEMVKAINSSGLPAFVLKVILTNLYDQLEITDNKEMEKYAESLKNKSKKGE